MKKMSRIETFGFNRKKFNVYILDNEPMFSLADLSSVLKSKTHKITKFISEENSFVGEFGSMDTTLRVFNLKGVKEALYSLVETEDISEFVEWFANTIIPFYKKYAVDTGNIGLLKNIKNNENEIEFIKQGIVKDTGDMITFLKKGEQYFFKAHEVTDYLRGLKTLPRTFNLANGYKQVVESERFDFKTDADIRKVVWLTMMGIDQILLYNPNRSFEMCAWLNTLNNFVEEDYKYKFSYVPPVEEVVEMETITIDEIDFSSKSQDVEEFVGAPMETKTETSDIQTFNFEELPVRTLEIDGEIYFVGKDVAEILGYSNSSKAVMKHVDKEDKISEMVPHSHIGNLSYTKTTLINESGIYSLIFAAAQQSINPIIKEKAKRFKRWVTSEVLPQIRKTGSYNSQPVVKDSYMIDDPVERAKAWIREQETHQIQLKEKEEVIQKMEPKVTYYDLIMSNSNLLTSGQIAEDYGMSARKFNELLNELRIHYKNGRKWYLYKEHKDKGYTNSYTFPVYNKKSEYQFHDTQTGWTQSGRKFIYDTLKKFDIIPLIEKNSNLDLVTA